VQAILFIILHNKRNLLKIGEYHLEILHVTHFQLTWSRAKIVDGLKDQAVNEAPDELAYQNT